MSSLDPGQGNPRIFIEVNVMPAELLTRGSWIFTEPDQVKPVLVQDVMLLSDKHGKFVRVTDTEGKEYVFRPDADDTVEVVV